MDEKEKLVELASHLREQIARLQLRFGLMGLEPKQLPEVAQAEMVSTIGTPAILSHLLWMCDKIPEMEADKINRWIGWIQGVLFASGWDFLQAQRELTRTVMHK